MVVCIVITLKEKTPKKVTTNEVSPHSFTSLPLQSNIDLLAKLRSFILKWKLVGSTIFSKSHAIYLFNRVFTLKSFCIIISSIIIGNLVRYTAIKYGIDNPLLFHPVLFSSAAGITSFLSIPSKITIETIFNIFSNKELAIIAGDSDVLSITGKTETTLKMVNNNPEGVGSYSENTISKDTSFSDMDDLLKKLQAQVDSAKDARYQKALDELKDLNTKLDK